MLAFLGLKRNTVEKQVRDQLKALVSDVSLLTDHSGFVAQKITVLLDATPGPTNIAQSAIIKIFAVAAVVFLPPMPVAAMCGMNFDIMPELE